MPINDIKVPPFTEGQKQIIEMTKKLAEKRGGKICDVDGIDDDITDIKELLNDTIKRIEEPTKEDWLKSLNTEQLAETILEMCKYKPCFACGIGHCDDENWCHVYSDEAKEFVLEWLKQPHTPKE